VSSDSRPDHVDAVVIGAGITGIYQVYLLRNLGFSVKGFDAASDVGGTWYWNRYPGCRLDTESYTYGYFCLIGITPDWKWSERFAGQPELLKYANHAADRMDIRKHFQFDTSVQKAIYNEADNIWSIECDDGSRVTCRYFLTAVGPLSASRMPDYAGMNEFKGRSFHSSRWANDSDGSLTSNKADFAGERVGIIGTGATGVQIIPVVAETASEVFVFQRSPNWCTPLGNGPICLEMMEELRMNYENILAYVKTTDTGFPYHRSGQRGVDASPEERAAFFERLYNMPGYGLWLASYRDLLTSKQSNAFIAEFVANKIRQRVRDPVLAEKLIPRNHPFGAKRVPMETNYYETFNQDHVRLIDIRETPILRIKPNGIETAAGEFDLDTIVYATGFDGVTGSLDRIDIRGRGGVSLKEVWKDGPVTYLGLQVSGFPNMFTLVGAHNGAAFCNIAVCGGLQVEWVGKMLRDMRNRNLVFSEAQEEAQAKWTDQVYKDFARTLMVEGDAWWVKITNNPDGTQTRRALAYVGGGPEYRKICDRVAYNRYEGFVLK
jgi:cation diffusion facilitator CzcD-associated flavoprotein CzcO